MLHAIDVSFHHFLCENSLLDLYIINIVTYIVLHVTHIRVHAPYASIDNWTRPEPTLGRPPILRGMSSAQEQRNL